MLRNLPPILSPDILFVLASMGHGDEVVIADANFPAAFLGPECHRLPGIPATDALTAVLTLLPLDSFVDDPALTMQVVGAPEEVPPTVKEFQEIIRKVADNPAETRSLERFVFYERAKTAKAVIQTGENRPYGNIILKKGVIFPNA